MRKKFPTKKGIIFVDDDSNVIVERPASIQRPHKWRDIIIGVLVSITLASWAWADGDSIITIII